MPSPPRVRRTLATMVVAALATTLGLTASNALASTPAAPNPITPGNFTGYGFDQCNAPSQASMTAWLKSSPFRAVGIYISGALRFCPDQPNLTSTWVTTQLSTGWRLLPIHLGAQASCSSRTRYKNDLINPSSTDDYAAARAQGRTEASTATAAAKALGIVALSTIYYDLESFNIKDAACRLSALKFLSAWTNKITANGYTSGVYSSAGSGIKVLDDARVTPGNTISMPYQIWIADWNGTASSTSTYLRSDGWPGRRLHQYQGGHNETWGGVTINIDRSWLNLAGGPATPPPPTTPEASVPAALADARCTTTSINRSAYRLVSPAQRQSLTVPLQCLLKQHGLYTVGVTGNWNRRTTAAVEAWQKHARHQQQRAFTRSDWVSLLSAGNAGTVLKPGIRGADVIRAQRAINAAANTPVTITGIYDATTQRAVAAYQVQNHISPVRGIVATLTWGALTQGLW
jgi:peptidoglycan hydrolase-like protein with peptidoglycan-binding domain